MCRGLTRLFGYPVIPLLYILGASTVLACLFAYRPSTTWPGLLIVLGGRPHLHAARAGEQVAAQNLPPTIKHGTLV